MLNLSILIGRLTREPELRYTPNGIATCTFTVAVDRPKKKESPGPDADFITVVAWRALAETCAQYLDKGKLVCVVGKTQTRNYEREGRKIYVTEVLADTVRFLDGVKQNAGDGPAPVEISDTYLPF